MPASPQSLPTLLLTLIIHSSNVQCHDPSSSPFSPFSHLTVVPVSERCLCFPGVTLSWYCTSIYGASIIGMWTSVAMVSLVYAEISQHKGGTDSFSLGRGNLLMIKEHSGALAPGIPFSSLYLQVCLYFIKCGTFPIFHLELVVFLLETFLTNMSFMGRLCTHTYNPQWFFD